MPGLWIDAVSGNEVLRAKQAGFAMGSEPPVVMLTTDVFRDNGIDVVLEEGVLPNVGSPRMITQLAERGYRGPIALRVNPGFGHGHVQSCDTGGPSSKHGIWFEDLGEVERLAGEGGLPRGARCTRTWAPARSRESSRRTCASWWTCSASCWGASRRRTP
ncbi:MAG: hypothetical protein U5Q44_13935 [Dehalococcoidia bacterium]|nr:hypothetical protein [Dehalococcoidia bacterium]